VGDLRGEGTSSTDWPTGGLTLANKQINTATANTIFLDADDTTSGPAATMADIRGVLVYNDTVTGDYGICYNAFGGAQQVTNGTFAACGTPWASPAWSSDRRPQSLTQLHEPAPRPPDDDRRPGCRSHSSAQAAGSTAHRTRAPLTRQGCKRATSST
jgi:hypothetical protein